ncbi:hypothetical protein MMU07_00220 [Aquiflexum sp. LQ15W]|uniref:hypothetical protein n=1 Tax=Cognataquiflexum nitidum TaxID=2922272 RepID=UPI001F12E91D|nr:hypothetical protein [Cognataquiflexum nitidum]MCH6197984.1 hypothetical protein [Cognataquiflexum nitidum]
MRLIKHVVMKFMKNLLFTLLAYTVFSFSTAISETDTNQIRPKSNFGEQMLNPDMDLNLENAMNFVSTESIFTHLGKNMYMILLVFVCMAAYSNLPSEDSPEAPVLWKPARSFVEGLTHAKEINGKLYAASKTRIYSDATIFKANKYYDLSYFLPVDFLYRLPISDLLLATINSEELILMPHGKPFEEDAFVFKMKDIDPRFIEFTQVVSGDQIGIDTRGNLLLPYKSLNVGKSKYSSNFLWLKTGVIDGKVAIFEQKLIKEEFFDDWLSIWSLKVFENFIRVTMENKTIDFDLTGSMELRFESYTKSVQVGNNIITFASEGFETFPLMVYRSDFSGKNPELIGSYNSKQISREDRRLLGIFFDTISSIHDKIFLFGGESIFRLSINDQTIKLIPLDNLGLMGTSITSINLIDNSTVFVTNSNVTSGKNCGGYYKPLENFDNQK